MDSLKQVAADVDADPNARRDALEVLVRSGEKDLAQLLRNLVTDRSVGAIAVKGLASVGAADTPDVLLKRFWQLPKDARPDAVAALTVREPWALALLDEVEKGEVPKELSHGVRRSSNVIARQRASGRATRAKSGARFARRRLRCVPTSNAFAANSRPKCSRRPTSRTAAVSTVACARTATSSTAKAPPSAPISRAATANLDYLLENLLDPSATVPEAYRSSVIVLKDGRVLTGVIAGQSENRLTLQTATDKQTLDAADVEEIKQTELSLMPNGQLDRLSEEEVRDLIAYLQSKSQVPLAGHEEQSFEQRTVIVGTARCEPRRQRRVAQVLRS